MNDPGYIHVLAAALLHTRTTRVAGLGIHEIANPFRVRTVRGGEFR